MEGVTAVGVHDSFLTKKKRWLWWWAAEIIQIRFSITIIKAVTSTAHTHPLSQMKKASRISFQSITLYCDKIKPV